MAAGIQIFNPDGSLQFDGGNRLYRLLTVADATGNGSVNVPALSEGTPMVSVAVTDQNKVAPEVSVTGTQVSWTYSGSSSSWDTDSMIYVAVY